MTSDRLLRQLDRAHTHDIAPGDDLPLHAANTADMRRDATYLDRWVEHEVEEGRTPDATLLDEARTHLDTRRARW